jgi:hypothetical protein
MLSRFGSCVVAGAAVLVLAGLAQPDIAAAGINDGGIVGAPAPLLGLGAGVGAMVAAVVLFVRRLGR